MTTEPARQPRPNFDGGGQRAAIVFVFSLIAAGILTVIALWIWGLPALAGFAAESVPREWERTFGAAVVADMVGAADRVTDPAVTAPVESIFARLVAAQHAPGDSFVVVVARDDEINAFAAPGGWVVVTTGLLRAVHGPDELAAVMAHEITHVVKRHSTRQIFQRLGLRLVIALVVGDQGLSGALGGAAGTLGELSNSRGDESEADAGGVRLLARAGIDPLAADRALASISDPAGRERGIPIAFLSTHPLTPQRREKVRELAEGLPIASPTATFGDAQWRGLEAALAVSK